MKLEKRQKMFLVIFLIGLAALGVDRTFLRPQGGARTASAESLGSGESAPSSAATTGPEDAAPGAGVAGRLHHLWSEDTADLEQTRDPFVLPPSWFDNVGENGVRIAEGVALFLHKHRLGAVVIEGQKTYALVNDRFLTPGQWLDGFQLVSVDNRSAVFERAGQRATLELAKE